MSEKPILFNTEMVKAILEGRKTVTRRIVKIPKCIEKQENGLYTLCAEDSVYHEKGFGEIAEYIKMPYQIGDILYVRETWCDTSKDMRSSCDWDLGECKYIFKVDDNGKNQLLIDLQVGRWRPSIHMPKSAARIFLRVANVRVERLQDITTDDCMDEGVNRRTRIRLGYSAKESMEDFNNTQLKDTFKKLWDSTIKKGDIETYGYKANPWVWVIEFERMEKSKGKS